MAASSTSTDVVRLHLICLAPPVARQADEDTEFGLQDKDQVLHAGRQQDDGSVRYDLDVRVKRDRETSALRFLGPYVHGNAAAPFLYLSWRRREPAPAPWIRRLKIPLRSITPTHLDAIDRAGGGGLEGRISGTGSGTVPLLGGGWTLTA